MKEFNGVTPIDRNNKDGMMGATAEPLTWNRDELSEKENYALDYLEGAAFLFRYRGEYVVTNESGDLSEYGDGTPEHPFGAPQGVFQTMQEVRSWLDGLAGELKEEGWNPYC